MRPFVILRPEPGASATAEAARKLGLEVLAMPLFEVKLLPWTVPEPDEFDALLFTSANAVRHGGSGLAQLRSLPAYCVGEATAAAARDVGFYVRATGNQGVDALLQSLPADQKLLHLCGSDWRSPSEPRQSIEHVPVYEAVELNPPPKLSEAQGAVVAVHSPRAAATFARLADEAALDRSSIAVAAISAAAAKATGDGWARVGIASEPNDPALLSLAAELCDNRG